MIYIINKTQLNGYVWNQFERLQLHKKRFALKNLSFTVCRGVVQLFNAVRQQQKTIDDEIYKVGPSERKQEKVMANMTKDKFLSILKGTSSSNVKVDTEQKVTNNALNLFVFISC